MRKKDEVKINLKNGTFVISKDKQELRDFDKPRTFLNINCLFEYNSKATCDDFKAFLNEVLPEKNHK